MLSYDIKKQIVDQIKKIKPYKIVLFGSHAYGKPNIESDVDLLVITKDEFLPKNFTEKNEIYLTVSNEITNIEKKYPIDLIVHTKAMHRKFLELDSMFSKKITAKGMVLYEEND